MKTKTSCYFIASFMGIFLSIPLSAFPASHGQLAVRSVFEEGNIQITELESLDLVWSAFDRLDEAREYGSVIIYLVNGLNISLVRNDRIPETYESKVDLSRISELAGFSIVAEKPTAPDMIIMHDVFQGLRVQEVATEEGAITVFWDPEGGRVPPHIIRRKRVEIDDRQHWAFQPDEMICWYIVDWVPPGARPHCGGSCPWCFIREGVAQVADLMKDWPTRKQVERRIQLLKENGFTVRMYGADIVYREDLFAQGEVLDAPVMMDQPQVSTAGVLIGRDPETYLELLAASRVPLIQMTLHATGEDAPHIPGVPRYRDIERACEFIHGFNEANAAYPQFTDADGQPWQFNITLNVLVGAWNYNRLGEYVEAAKKLGAHTVRFVRLIPELGQQYDSILAYVRRKFGEDVPSLELPADVAVYQQIESQLRALRRQNPAYLIDPETGRPQIGKDGRRIRNPEGIFIAQNMTFGTNMGQRQLGILPEAERAKYWCQGGGALTVMMGDEIFGCLEVRDEVMRIGVVDDESGTILLSNRFRILDTREIRRALGDSYTGCHGHDLHHLASTDRMGHFLRWLPEVHRDGSITTPTTVLYMSPTQMIEFDGMSDFLLFQAL